MITLIAESKKMASCTSSASEEAVPSLKPHVNLQAPIFGNEAADIMAYLASLGPSGIAKDMKVTMSLALKAYDLALDYTLKGDGYAAIEAFTGEVFRSMNFKEFPKEAKIFAEKHLLIISSLFGLLRINDEIRPYRLNYNVPCAPGGENISSYWKPKITVALAKYLQESGEREIVNLLPGDAAKCIDWKVISKYADVIKPDFKVVAENGELKSPDQRKLKWLRGKMVNAIMNNSIDSLEAINSLVTPWFGADIESGKPGMPLFIAI